MLVEVPKMDASGGSVEPKRAVAAASKRNAHLWMSLLCVAVYGAAVAIVWPVVELATDDDFAYSRTALAFAHTGHFVYNGWETAMLGWQVVWGALFIRLFGYSYLTLRLSTIILGAILAFLLHRIMLRAGISAAAAAAGTLTVVLSPLYLPMATSYMTDVPAMLCILVCLYGCQRALRAGSDRAALMWLCGSAALNVLDGTVRQIVWLGTLVMVPSAFWLLRRRRGFTTAAVVTWSLSFGTIALLMRWFSHQPYSLPEHIVRGQITLHTLWRILRISIYGPLEVLCFSLPVFAAWIMDVRQLSRRRRVQILIVCAISAPLLLWAAHYNKIQGRLPPWSPNIVSRYGILWSVPLMGERPVILSTQVTSMIAIGLIAALIGFVLWLRAKRRTGWAKPDAQRKAGDETLSLYEDCVLILPFMAAYFALLLPRAAFPSTFSDVFDRYYLPLIMLAIVLLLRLLEEDDRKLPVTCYALLLLFSFFAVAGMHDVFTAYRAIANARAEVLATGVPAVKLSGPWQQDGAEQIDLQGYINEDRLENPPGSYRKIENPPLERCGYWFGGLVPVLHPQYVLTVERLKCLQPSQFPDLNYTTWLPPFERTIYIERNPDEH